LNYITNVKEAEHRDELTAKVNKVIDRHVNILYRKYRQTYTEDDYGNYLPIKFKKELLYFIDNVIYRDIDSEALTKANIDEPCLVALIRKKLIRYEDALSESDRAILFSDDMSPEEFEAACAQSLEDSGWQVRKMAGSGDQGVDLLAKKDNTTAAIQCKLYSRPVGNKAVQEAFAGKEYADADVAAVVTNNRFTQSARQLAAKNGVELFHYEDLPNLGQSVVVQ